MAWKYFPDSVAYCGSRARSASAEPENAIVEVVIPRRLDTHSKNEVLDNHCKAVGMSRRKPVSGIEPGSKAIDAMELPARSRRRASS